jgi:ABC-2 type transport system ATP-binding protein
MAGETTAAPPATTAAGEKALEVENLVKVYAGNVRAVDGVSFSIGAGEVFGLLGPNGAGKTTTIKTIATLVRPTSGSVRVAGKDVVKDPDGARASIGYVPQELALDRLLTVREHIELSARLQRLPAAEVRARTDELLALVELSHKESRRAKTLSGGEKRRLDLAMGLVNKPRLLILDEPTVGLDIQTRQRIWDFLGALRARGTTVLLTTHYMEEADRLCSRIAIIDRGRIVKQGRPQDLRAEIEGDVIEVRLEGDAAPPDELVKAIEKMPSVKQVVRVREALDITAEKDPAAVSKIVETVTANGRALASVTYRRPTLDDVFVRATGRALRD